MLPVARICFYGFLLSLPFGIGFLFLTPDVSVDFFNPYLSHQLYLADFFWVLGVLFMVWAFLRGKVGVVDWRGLFESKFFVVALSFLTAYLLSIFFSEYPLNSLIYLLRIFEFFVFGALIFVDLIPARRVVSLFVCVVSLIAVIGILQFIFQHSLGLHFIGEPVLFVEKLGVAKVEVFGETFLRIYGTFPHPNVFAGYLLVAMLGAWKFRKDGLMKFALVVCCTALILTFSRSAWLALLVFVLWNLKSRFSLLYGVIIAAAFFFLFFDLSELAVLERLKFLEISKNIFFAHPFGVGAGNFTAVMPEFSPENLAPWQIQPVHNIFFLLLNEAGLIGFMLIVFAFLYKRFLPSVLILILVIGLFDHYFISLYQGQFLFAFILAQTRFFDSR